MIRAFYFVCDFLYTAAKIWGTMQLMEAIMEPKQSTQKRYAIWIMVTIIVAGLNTLNNSMICSLFSKWFMIIIVLLLSLVGSAAYYCRYWDAFCDIFILWTELALADFLFQTIAYVILADTGIATDIFLKATLHRGIYMLLCTILLCVAVRFMCRWMKGKESVIRIKLKWKWLLVPTLYLCMVYFQRIYVLLFSEQMMRNWWLFLSGNILMILIFTGYFFVRKEKEHSRLQQLKMDMMEYDYRALQKVYEEKEILLHDVKKHMQVIRGMVEAGQKQEIFVYLDEMSGMLKKGRNRDLVNHDLLNLILNHKFQEAENTGISIQYETEDMGGLRLKPTEVCALFSNILDNAIEANQKIAEGMERWIKLACTRKGQILVIYISNPMAEKKIRLVGGIPETTKQDKGEHGFGMRSIRQIVNTYDGHMLIETEDGIFHFTVYLKGF